MYRVDEDRSIARAEARQLQAEIDYRRELLNEGPAYAACGHAAPLLSCEVCMAEWRRQERDGNAARDYGIFNG